MVQAEGSRPLIFSQWTTVLDLVEALLDSLSLPYLRLDGSTPVPSRLALVDQYVHRSQLQAIALFAWPALAKDAKLYCLWRAMK